MISHKTLDSKKNIVQKTLNSEVAISNNSVVTVVNNARHRHETNLFTEGVSNVNHWLNIKIIRNVKEDKNKVYNVSEMYIIEDSNKNFNSVDITSIKDSKIPGTTLITTDGNKKIISSNEEILNTKFLCGIEQQNNRSESKYTTDSITKTTVNNNTIEHESELTNNRNKINEYNNYKNNNIFYQEKSSKQSLTNNNNVETEDISKPINRHTNADKMNYFLPIIMRSTYGTFTKITIRKMRKNMVKIL